MQKKLNIISYAQHTIKHEPFTYLPTCWLC